MIIGDGGKLEFFSPADSNIYTYKLQVTTNELLYVFRISNDEKEVSLRYNQEFCQSFLHLDRYQRQGYTIHGLQ